MTNVVLKICILTVLLCPVAWGATFDATKFTDKFRKEIDLNGDGINELISVKEEPELHGTFLCINGAKVERIIWNPYSFYKIVDVNRNDKYKEIETYVNPEPSATFTKLFTFDGKKTIDMGTLRTAFPIAVDGTGFIKSSTEGKVFRDILFRDTHAIDMHHKIYEMINNDLLYELNAEVTMKTDLELQKSKTDESAACVLKQGEKARIIGTDNYAWCLAENAKGQKGWFAVDDFLVIRKNKKPAPAVFEGLFSDKAQTLDLNGDGIMEQLFIIPGDHYSVFVSIGEKLLYEGGQGCDVKVVDIDAKDRFKEIAVSDEGPSDDYSTRFYYYDGKDIIKMGTVGGLLRFGTVIDSSGELKAEERSVYLQTCFYQVKYRINERRQLVKVPEKYYRLRPKSEVTVLKKLMLKKSPDDPVLSHMLQPGQKVTIIYGNDNGWFAAKDDQGKIGWFKVYDYDKMEGNDEPAGLYFDGLFIAD